MGAAGRIVLSRARKDMDEVFIPKKRRQCNTGYYR